MGESSSWALVEMLRANKGGLAGLDVCYGW
jgi:hypothetical protein